MPDNARTPSRVINAVSAASDLWSAFNSWLQILEDTLGALETGRIVTLEDEATRQAVSAAIAAAPWSGELSTYLATFDKASGFVETWTTVGEPPRGTGGLYLRVSVRDARAALGQLAGFLFERLRMVTLADDSGDR